jgi:hypothetical protein
MHITKLNDYKVDEKNYYLHKNTYLCQMLVKAYKEWPFQAHVYIYLVATKCLTYLPPYIITNHISYLLTYDTYPLI